MSYPEPDWVVAMAQPEPDEEQLTFFYVKEDARFNLNAKGFATDLALQPGMRVSGTWDGVVAWVRLEQLDSGKKVLLASIVTHACDITE